jgi:hypothetical protein
MTGEQFTVRSSIDLELTQCSLFGPLEQAVTAIVILSLGTYGQNGVTA